MEIVCKDMEQLIRKECAVRGVVENVQIDYIVATAMWETNHTCKPVREAYWLSDKWRERHLRYYPYYGRGFVQITWEANYKKFGELLGIDLVNNPDLALEPENAVKILVIGMRDGLFTGYSLKHFFTNDGNNFKKARKIINGMDKAETIASMAQNINLA